MLVTNNKLLKVLLRLRKNHPLSLVERVFQRFLGSSGGEKLYRFSSGDRERLLVCVMTCCPHVICEDP